MPVKLIESEQPISTSDFLAFTKSINAHPTSEFINFYLTNNGGFIDDKQHTESELLINSFLSIKYGEATIENVYKQLVKSTPSLAGLIPFAYDDCGNLFLLSASSPLSRSICTTFTSMSKHLGTAGKQRSSRASSSNELIDRVSGA